MADESSSFVDVDIDTIQVDDVLAMLGTDGHPEMVRVIDVDKGEGLIHVEDSEEMVHQLTQKHLRVVEVKGGATLSPDVVEVSCFTVLAVIAAVVVGVWWLFWGGL